MPRTPRIDLNLLGVVASSKWASCKSSRSYSRSLSNACICDKRKLQPQSNENLTHSGISNKLQPSACTIFRFHMDLLPVLLMPPKKLWYSLL